MIVFVSSAGKVDARTIVPLTSEKVIVPPPARLTSRIACLKDPGPASELLLTVKFTHLPVVLTIMNTAIAKDTCFIFPCLPTILHFASMQHRTGVRKQWVKHRIFALFAPHASVYGPRFWFHL